LQDDDIFAGEIDFACSGNALLAAFDDNPVDQASATTFASTHGAKLFDQCPADLLPAPARHRSFQFAHAGSSARLLLQVSGDFGQLN